RLDVEVDVRLRPEVDAEIAERRLERRQHAVGRKLLVPEGRAKDARRVPALGLGERHTDAFTEEAVADVLPETLGVVEEGTALLREAVEVHAEAVAVELQV